jgi:PAS domain S-box-containing protein
MKNENMGKLLNLLIIEDSENDTELLLEELRRKNCRTLHTRVQNATELTAALGSRTWDVIISDYVMPEFSGPEALKLIREKNLDLPFIVVSGTYGEEAAVDMMKAGANDYIVKGNLSRLAPAIEREITAAQTRQARVHAESAMHFLAAIVESTDDAIYSKTPDGTIVSWNRAAERIYGYSAEEVIGRSISLIFPAERRDELINIMSRIKQGRAFGPYETERRHKNGHCIPVSVTISPIKIGEDKIAGASVIARDISKRKREEQERFKLIHELTVALKEVKTLNGLVPICSSCKRIRNDQGYWQQVEIYLSQHSEAVFAHGTCPECLRQSKIEV